MLIFDNDVGQKQEIMDNPIEQQNHNNYNVFNQEYKWKNIPAFIRVCDYSSLISI